MKVILKENISNLGTKGEVKNVSDGYARNYLIPKGMAEEATPARLKEWEKQKKIIEKKEQKEEEKAREIAEKLEGQKINFKLKAGEEGRLFGSATSADISEALKEKGYEIDKRKIELEDPIKNTGNHEIEIKLMPGITTRIQVEIEGTK